MCALLAPVQVPNVHKILCEEDIHGKKTFLEEFTENLENHCGCK